MNNLESFSFNSKYILFWNIRFNIYSSETHKISQIHFFKDFLLYSHELLEIMYYLPLLIVYNLT